MANRRKTYAAQFKFERAIESIKKDNISEISRAYDIGINVLCNWKKQLFKNGSNIFETSPDKENKKLKQKIKHLEQLVGKKEIELNVLKNFSDFYESPNTT